jgi:hypothetical protein
VRTHLLLVALIAAAILGLGGASAEAYVYWSDQGPFNGGGGTTLVRANQDGSGLRSPFVTTQANPTGIAVGGQYVYWVNSAANAIGRAKLDGTGANQTFITGAAAPTNVTGRSPQGVVLGLAVDTTYIYWTDNAGFIGRAKLDGTGKSSTWVDTGQLSGAFGIAVTPTSIFVGVFFAIQRIPIQGTSPHVNVATDANWIFPPSGLAVSGSYVYYTAAAGAGPNNGFIGRVAANDTNDSPTPHDNTFITNLEQPIGLGTDGTWLYWADNKADTIGRARIASPAQRDDAFINDSGGPFGLAVDAGIDPTTTSVSCTPASVAPGATTTCRATVSDGASSSVATGLVTFSGNATTPFLGGGSSTSCTLTADPGGGASCVVGAVPQAAGTAPIGAAYGGDAVHGKSSGSTSVCVGTVAECGGTSGPPGGGGGGGGTLPGGGGGSTPTPTPLCVVPKLRGKSLAAARRLLVRAGCAVGKVKRPRRPRHGRLRPLVVSAQSAKAGASVARGTKVRLTLKQKPRRR